MPEHYKQYKPGSPEYKKAKAEHIKSQEGRREKLRELLPMGNYSLSAYKKDTLSLPKHKLMKPIKLKKKD